MGKLVGTILRFVFSWIDAILVKLITTIYKLFSNLSELVLYSDNIIKLIGKRIGLILGIFMLFKLAISLINYMISPDKISDKSKGGGRLIINVGVSLALLISVNFIFKEAYMIQGVIVNSKIIEKIFFGNNGIINKDDSLETKMDIGYYLYSGFITPNVEVFGHSCDEMWDVSVNLQELTDTQKANDDTNVCDDLLIDKLSDNAYKSVYKARNTMDMSYVFYDHELLLESPSERVFAFDYTPIISTAAGVIVLLVLLSFSMDLATRAVKLLFLQIIAPIPIISNMDMGKGQDIFKKWGKECINTYLSVFIRLIAINFAVFMIVLLRGNYKNLFVNNVWLNIFLIIGCLMFAKQVPGLIEEFLGIKLNGMALHPLKKFQEQALFGKQIGGFAKGAIGGVVGGFAAGSLATGAGLLTGQGLGAGKAFSTAFRNGIKGEKFGKNFSGSYSAVRARHTQLQDIELDGVSRSDIFSENLKSKFGMETDSSKVNRLINQGKAIQSAYDAIKNQIIACDSIDGNAASYNGQVYSKSAKTISKELDELKKTTVDRQSFRDQASSRAIAANGRAVSEDQIQAEMDRLYDAAVSAQKQKIIDTEKELEGRINAVVSALFDDQIQFTTSVPSADKIIKEQTKTINTLKKKSNDLGKEIDSGYVPISVDDYDVVNIMKQGKAIGAQASSGRMQDITDAGKYVKSGKK